MPNQLANQITTPTQEEMFEALGTAYVRCMGGPPTKEKLCLLMAQSAFETGWWKAMHCNNIGNVKSVDGDGRDYTFFRCWEMMSEESAKTMQENPTYGSLVSIESVEQDRAKVWLAPNHPGCRFRAYTTLALGVFDHLSFLIDYYSDDNPDKNAWSFVVQANPEKFVHAIKLKGYFTGDEVTYTANVKSIFTSLCSKNFDVDQFATHSTSEENEISNWRIMATSTGMAESLNTSNSDDDKT